MSLATYWPPGWVKADRLDAATLRSVYPRGAEVELTQPMWLLFLSSFGRGYEHLHDVRAVQLDHPTIVVRQIDYRL